MALSATVQMALIGATFLAAFAVAKHLDLDRRIRSLPTWLIAVVAGIAVSPTFLLDRGVVPEGIVDDSVVVFAVSLLLWIGLPFVLSRLVGTDPKEPTGTCQHP